MEGGDGFYVSARRVALNFPGYGIAKMGHRSSLHSEKCSPASRRASPSPPRATDSREMSRALRPTPVTRARSGVGGFSQARHGRDASHASCAAWKARKGISGKRFVGFHARRDRVTSLQRARSSNSDSRSEDSDIESMVDIESIKAMLEDDPEVKAQERKIANTAQEPIGDTRCAAGPASDLERSLRISNCRWVGATPAVRIGRPQSGGGGDIGSLREGAGGGGE